MILKSLKLNEMTKKWICRIFSVFILIQPLLDLFTSLAKHAGIDLTIGILVRSLFMITCVIFILFFCRGKSMVVYQIYIIALSLYCLFFLLGSFYQGGIVHAVGNLKELIKCVYFLYVFAGVYCLYQITNFTISDRVLSGTLSIYLLVIFLAFITDSSFQSYTYGAGYSGWYYAANEISSIIAVLSPIAVVYCVKLFDVNKGFYSVAYKIIRIIAAIILLFLISFCASFIGTKAVFAAIFIYVSLLILWALCRWMQTKKKEYGILAIISTLIFFLIIALLFISPLKENLQRFVEAHPTKIETTKVMSTFSEPGTSQQSSADQEITTQIKEEAVQEKPLTVSESVPDNQEMDITTNKLYLFFNRILSNRLEYVKPSIIAFTNGSLGEKLFGIGYVNLANSTHNIEKSIEMDGLAILIRHGILGLVIYFIPLLYFGIKTVLFIIRHLSKFLSSLSLCTYFYSILIGLFLAFVAGHTLVAPAVSIYLVLLIVKQIHEMKSLADYKKEE